MIDVSDDEREERWSNVAWRVFRRQTTPGGGLFSESRDTAPFMALADSESAELRARAEKAEAEAATLLLQFKTQWDAAEHWSAEAFRLRDGIQALADEATWLDFQEFFDRESPWYDPHEGLARVARALLNPTPEDKP